MKIELLEIKKGFIEFKSPLGIGSGKCNDLLLEVGKVFDAEFDFNKELSIGEDFEKVEKTTPFFSWNGKTNSICGLVESIDEDNEVCLRLAADLIILFYLQAGEVVIGETIKIKVDKEVLCVSMVGGGVRSTTEGTIGKKG